MLVAKSAVANASGRATIVAGARRGAWNASRSKMSSAALHQTPTPAASHESSHQQSQYEPYAGTTHLKRTQLPTPLPHEVTQKDSTSLHKRSLGLRSGKEAFRQPPPPLNFGDLSGATLHALEEDHSFFPPSRSLENLSILQACLSTGLIQRADKMFGDMRSEASYRIAREGFSDASTSKSSNTVATLRQSLSPLDITTYNAMLGAYFRKAWQQEDWRLSAEWVAKAWRLYEDMERGTDLSGHLTADPLPDQATLAVLSKGIVRLQRSGRYPTGEHPPAYILSSAKRLGIRIQDVIFSPILTQDHMMVDHLAPQNMSKEGEPDAKVVLQYLSSAAADTADVAMSAELDQAHRSLLKREEMKEVDI